MKMQKRHNRPSLYQNPLLFRPAHLQRPPLLLRKRNGRILAIAVEKPAAPAETPAPAVPEEPPKQDVAPVSPLSVVKETAVGSSVQEAPPQVDDFEEILWEEAAQDTPVAPAVPAAPAYTSDTPVDTILSLMTLEEARSYKVKEGSLQRLDAGAGGRTPPGKPEILRERLFRER